MAELEVKIRVHATVSFTVKVMSKNEVFFYRNTNIARQGPDPKRA